MDNSTSKTVDRYTLTDTNMIKSTSEPNFITTRFPLSSKNSTKTGSQKKLKKQLKEATCQNESLENAIKTKNTEIGELKKSVQSLNEVINSVPIDDLRNNSSIASSKIIELSKRNRQLRVELEVQKNRNMSQEIKIQKLENTLKAKANKKEPVCETPHKTSNTSSDEMQSKLSAIQQKLFESRNVNVELRNQLKLANKCLQQEIGENFNLNILASAATQSTWRGRAQQIIGLQQKVSELKEKLELVQHSKEIATAVCPYNQHNIGAGDERCQLTGPIRKKEIVNRQKLEEMEKEIVSLKEQLEEQRTKVSALKVRNKTLIDDSLKYKMRAMSLVEQTDMKETSITDLNDKLNIQRSQYENRIKEISKEIASMLQHQMESEVQQEQLQIKIQNLYGIINGKEQLIEELNGTIERLEQDLRKVCGDFLFSCRELRKDEFVAILDSLETEKNNLLEYTKQLNERLSQEREKYDSLSDQLTKQKIRAARLEGKIRDMEKEQEIQAEKKKRSMRISEYANSVNGTASSLSSFVFENTSTVFGESSNLFPKTTDDDSKYRMEELQNSLELAKEKIKILEEKISYMTDEKANDAKVFEEILRNSKNVLLDTILSNRSNTAENPSNEKNVEQTLI